MKKLPQLGRPQGINGATHDPQSILRHLPDRLRRVRAACGDWTRVVCTTATTHHGLTSVFLDPPYCSNRESHVYANEMTTESLQVRDWAVEHGDDERFRIALCGHEGEHDMPDSWDCVAWKGHGSWGLRSDGQGRANRDRERIWFSPHCLKPLAHVSR